MSINKSLTNPQGSKTMHTPGPWETSRDAVPDGHTQITVYEQQTGHRVATAFQTEANANLIKAAPDLLEALAACKAAAENKSLPPSARLELIRDISTPLLRAAGL